MSNNLQLKQTMLSLAYTADLSANLTGNVQSITAAIKPKIECMLEHPSALKGEWKLVWGPVVYKFPHVMRADNTMFVAQNANNSSTYAVCIAGTNPKSISDWFAEDFSVLRQTAWPYDTPPESLSPKISHGTSTGLSVLQHMQPLRGLPGAGLLLTHFLNKELSKHSDGVTIYVTGHSLGGALAPTTALWLTDSQGCSLLSGETCWDPEKKATIKTYAFAVPTPGNHDFASWMNTQLSGDKMVVVNNTIDIVPHAWNSQTLSEIPELYGAEYEPGLILRKAIEATGWFVKELDYQEIGSGDQVQPIEGAIWTEPNPSDWSDIRFLTQAGYQHVKAYPELLELPDLLTIMGECKNA